MTEWSVQDSVKRIRKVIHHIGTFEQAFPKVLEETSDFTRSHLVVLQDSLPDLKRILRYASQSIPAAARMTGTASQGVENVSAASAMLGQIRQSTENAVNDIFDVMERIEPLMDRVAESGAMDDGGQKALAEARDELGGILSALQFQDITSQQIEATNALLAQLSDSLRGLHDGDDDLPGIEVKEGTYDVNARYDRQQEESGGDDGETVSQEEVNRLLANGRDD